MKVDRYKTRDIEIVIDRMAIDLEEDTDKRLSESIKTAIMWRQKFGKGGDSIVIEEFLTGPEVSVLSFTDGKTVVPMISSMDHKRALDNDKGLNTGGMGTVAPNPYYTKEIADRCMKET